MDTGSISKAIYVLVKWPESQKYMEEVWFADEAISAMCLENSGLDAAYFIPKDRYTGNID